MFATRFLEVAAQAVCELARGLKITDGSCDAIWHTVLHVVSTAPEVLVGRDLDHIVLCAIYAISKLSHEPVASFNGIIHE